MGVEKPTILKKKKNMLKNSALSVTSQTAPSPPTTNSKLKYAYAITYRVLTVCDE